jgi:hypothetical protein
MNANEVRQLVTEEFMTFGLGAKLTGQADSFISDRDSNDERVLALGSIVERTLWIGLGRWLRYFDPVVSITSDEMGMLREHRTALAAEEWPELFSEVTQSLISYTGQAAEFGDPLISSELAQGEESIFPIFQAATLLAEDLTEGQMTIFFRYLRYGNKDIFQELPAANALFDALHRYDRVEHVASDIEKPGVVLAGFIRYTEFLSAMDDLFPTVNEHEADTNEEVKAMQSAPRELLATEIAKIIQWRIPSDREAVERYKAARTTLFKVWSTQLDAHQELALQWSEFESFGALIHLSNRFFAVAEWIEAPEFESFTVVDEGSLKEPGQLSLGAGSVALGDGESDENDNEDEEDYDAL